MTLPRQKLEYLELGSFKSLATTWKIFGISLGLTWNEVLRVTKGRDEVKHEFRGLLWGCHEISPIYGLFWLLWLLKSS